jgi:hypothetical protein
MYSSVSGRSATCGKGERKEKMERKEILKRLSQGFIRPRQQVKTHYTDRHGSDVTACLEERHSCRIKEETEVKQPFQATKYCCTNKKK